MPTSPPDARLVVPALPQPHAGPVVANSRALASDLEGPKQFRSNQREYVAKQSLQLFLNRDQASAFQTFWRDTLVLGGLWFLADWPTPTGELMLRRFLGAPKWQYVHDGAWRVGFEVELVAYVEGPAVGTELIRLEFSQSPVVDSTGNGWELLTSQTPVLVNGALRARPYNFTYYASMDTNDAQTPGLLLPTLQFTMEFYFSRQGGLTPPSPAASWEVGFDINFRDHSGVTDYDLNSFLTVGYVHNDPGQTNPWILWFIDGSIWMNINPPNIVLTAQSGQMTHIAFTFDQGIARVWLHGVLVYTSNPGDVEVDPVNTGITFPSGSIYAWWSNMVQFFGDTTPSYLDDFIVTAGLKYTANFTPAFKALPA